MTIKPGTRWLLLACFLAFPLIFTSPVERLDRNLYDAQLRLARALFGRQSIHPGVAVLALDERALERGLGASDLVQAKSILGPSSGLVSGREMAPFYGVDEDGTLRAVTLVRRDPDGLKLAPPLRHLLAFQGLTEADVSWDGHLLSFGRTTLPTDSQGRVYPLFPLTEMQNDARERPFSAAGLRTLVDLLHGLGELDALVPGSLVDLPNIQPEGKLIILGAHQKMADELELPTPTGNMVSLELYTITVDSLLQGRFLRPIASWANALLTFVFLAVFCHQLPGQRTANAVGTWLIGVICWLGLGLALFNNGYFAPHLAPALIMSVLALFAHILLRAQRLARTLAGFGGRELSSGQEKEITATICFTNLPGLIKGLEKSSPEQSQAARAAYARCLGHVVKQHGGFLVDQQGDAQMLAFGLEGEPNHQALAIACALHIVSAIEQLLRDNFEGPMDGTGVHCGVVTGTVASGQVGGGSYRSVAAIGDTTNAAARLMGQAEKRSVGVLASRSTTDGLGARLESRSAGEITLRGRQEPLQVDEVLSFSSPPRPLAVRPSTAWPRAAVLWLMASVLLATLAAGLLDELLPFRLALLDTLTPSQAKANVVFAGIDEESLSRLPWPWPRGLHAQAIENCRKAQAACIFFDIVFDRPSASLSDDQALARTVRDTPNVVLATVLGNRKPPQLIEGLLDTGRWGLINVATDTAQGDRRSRRALWQWVDYQLDDPSRTKEAHPAYPGAAQSMARIIAPAMVPRLQGEADFFLRWGPPPRIIDYHRLLDPNDPILSELSGSVVVVGDNTASPEDSVETPWGLKKGAYVHAMAAQTMMTGGVLLDRSRGAWSWVMALSMAAITTILAMRSTGPGHQVALLLGLLAVALGIVLLAVQAGYYLGTRGIVAIPCALLLGICLQAMGLTQALLRYVPQRLQQRLETEDSVPDKEVVATVMVTDIRGYTTLSEKRTPLEILKLLNRYHEVTAACYESFGGHLLTYQGDAQIVVFGALDPLGSPVLSAIKAAQRLPELVTQVSEEFSLDQAEKLSVGAGVATGRMSLVLMKAGDQLQYTVLGEPIRRAHGLQSLSDELDSSLLLDAESAHSVADVLTTRCHTSAQRLTAYTL